jgi:hypothetical protein
MITAIAARRPADHGRLLVLVLYGSLLAQVAEFAAYNAAHLPRTVNVAQFACIGIEAAAWTGVRRLTRDLTGRRRLDERELAIRDRAAWLTLRILTLAFGALAGGYVLLRDGTGWLPAPSPQWLSLIAFTAWMVVWTLPSAVLAWTCPPSPATPAEP